MAMAIHGHGLLDVDNATSRNAHIDALAASLLDRRHTASITMLPSAGGLSLDAAGEWPMVVVVRMWRMARGWRA